MSNSEHWRQEGNVKYKSVKPGMAPTVAKERLKEAIPCYQRAFDLAKNEEEKSSAAKNMGMVSWKLVTVTCEGTVPSQDMHLLVYHCKQAFKYFSFAYIHGQRVKPPLWIEGVLSSTRACWEHVSDSLLDQLSIEPRCQAIYDIAMTIEIDLIKGHGFWKLAECQFHRGILALQSNDYKTCLSAMRECYMPLNEAQRLCTDEDLQKEVRVLESDVHMHTCMAESIQARVIGDDLFEKVLRDEETLNIDMVWEVIDWYTQATISTKSVTELELEAIAVSRIGRIYDKVLKLKYRAKEYYKHAIQLAYSMEPRIFTKEEWFREATETLAKYQKETVQYEEELRNKVRAEILTELQADIIILNNQSGLDDRAFLTLIYEKFPPRKDRCKLVLPPKGKDYPSESKKMKKVLQKAVIHYHPDSVDAEKHGMKWKVLSEEICKRCTSRYEQKKGC